MLKIEDLGVTRKEAILSNGIKVILFEKPGMPAYLRAAFVAGSKYDPAGEEGTAHFVEHMIVAGTKKFPSKDKLAVYIEECGGGFQAITGKDVIFVNVGVGDPLDVGKAVEVLSETITFPLFEEKTIEAERKSILNEIGEWQTNPQKRLSEVFIKLFFQQTEVGRTYIGERAAIGKINKTNLLDYFTKMFVSENMVLLVAGGINFNELCKVVESKLLVRHGKRVGTGVLLPIVRERSLAVTSFKGGDQVFMRVGFRVPGLFSSDTSVLDIIAEVLGGGRAAILMRRLRYEKGLVYDISAGRSETLEGGGTWEIETSTSKKDMSEVLKIIAEEINGVVRRGLSDEQISFAKNKILKHKRIEMQTSGSWVNLNTEYELFNEGKIYTLTNYAGEIEAVTRNDILKVAGQYFLPDKWYLAACGDIKEEDIKFNL